MQVFVDPAAAKATMIATTALVAKFFVSANIQGCEYSSSSLASDLISLFKRNFHNSNYFVILF